MPVDVSIQADSIAEVVRTLGATEAQAERALRRAVRHAARWASSRVVRAVSAASNVRAKVLRGRQGRGDASSVEMDLSPVDVGLLDPRASGDGISAAGRSYSGGFVRQKRGELVAYRRRGAERYPIDILRQPIEADGMRALDRLSDAAGAELVREFERALSQEMGRG